MNSENDTFEALKYRRTVTSSGTISYSDANGWYHREDGPAYVNTNGLVMYYKHGILHREDGPAYINPDGTQVWFLNGEPVIEPDFESKSS